MGISDHLTCLLRNLYAGQEAAVRTRHGTTDWFQIEKGVCQGCVLSPCLFNFYAENIMRNAGLEEAQAGIKIAGRNINNMVYPKSTQDEAHFPFIESIAVSHSTSYTTSVLTFFKTIQRFLETPISSL